MDDLFLSYNSIFAPLCMLYGWYLAYAFPSFLDAGLVRFRYMVRCDAFNWLEFWEALDVSCTCDATLYFPNTLFDWVMHCSVYWGNVDNQAPFAFAITASSDDDR